MQSKLIHEHDGQKTFALIFATGDEVASGLAEFARAAASGGSFHGHWRTQRRDLGLLRLGKERLFTNSDHRTSRGAGPRR